MASLERTFHAMACNVPEGSALMVGKSFPHLFKGQQALVQQRTEYGHVEAVLRRLALALKNVVDDPFFSDFCKRVDLMGTPCLNIDDPFHGWQP